MRTDTLWVVKKSLDIGSEAKVLEDIFRNKPFMSKAEAFLYFGGDVSGWIRNEVVPIKKYGRNRKAEIPVRALIHARVSAKIEDMVKNEST